MRDANHSVTCPCTRCGHMRELKWKCMYLEAKHQVISKYYLNIRKWKIINDRTIVPRRLHWPICQSLRPPWTLWQVDFRRHASHCPFPSWLWTMFNVLDKLTIASYIHTTCGDEQSECLAVTDVTRSATEYPARNCNRVNGRLKFFCWLMTCLPTKWSLRWLSKSTNHVGGRLTVQGQDSIRSRW